MVKGTSGQLLREHTKFVSLSARSVHLRQQHVLMQPRRLSRAAGKLCRKHAWNARSKQRHVPDAKQILLWKGWVLKQRLNDVQSCVGATAARAHVESLLRTELFVDSCSVGIRATAARAHAKSLPLGSPSAHKAQRDVHAIRLLRSHATSPHGSPSVRKETSSGEKTAVFSRREHTWIFFQKKTCSCDSTAAFARCEHTWISLRAQRNMSRRKDCCVLTLRAHLDLFPNKKTCSCDNTAAFARCEHTWISLRAQRDMSRRKDCCVLTPRAHLDLAPCALGSRSVRKETCSIETAAISRCPPR